MSHPTALFRCVGETSEFLRDVFGAEPRLHHGGPYDDLLSLGDVDAALTGHGLRRPAVRLVRNGDVIDPASWTRRARTGSMSVDDVVDAGQVLQHYAGGATIVLQSLQRWWPPITRFCRDLERSLTHAVQANAYLTGPGAVGLAPHHDTHDVFVLQIHGTKRWTIREPLVDAPLRRHRSRPEPSGQQPVLFETELEPGMCMYLPRGVIHSASTQQGSSLHLTIGVLATTAADVVRRVAHLAGDVPALRRDLPPGWADDRATVEQVVKDIIGELITFAGSLDAADVTEYMADRFMASRPSPLDGRLLDLDRAVELDDHTVVVRRDHATLRVGVTDGTLQIRLPDRTIELPAVLEPVVATLIDGRPRSVGELHDVLDASSRLVLVGRLVREGILRIDGSPWPDRAPGSEQPIGGRHG